MSQITVKGHDFELDMLDLDVYAQNIENSAALAQTVADNDLAVGVTIEKLSAVYEAIRLYFDQTLGEGALAKILDGKRRPLEALDAYYDLRDAIVADAERRATLLAGRRQLPKKYATDRLKRG